MMDESSFLTIGEYCYKEDASGFNFFSFTSLNGCAIHNEC